MDLQQITQRVEMLHQAVCDNDSENYVEPLFMGLHIEIIEKEFLNCWSHYMLPNFSTSAAKSGSAAMGIYLCTNFIAWILENLGQPAIVLMDL